MRQWFKKTSEETTEKIRSLRVPRVPRWVRIAFAWTVLIVGIVFLVGAAMEFTSSGKIAKGVSIDGVPVGGMTRTAAKKAVSEKVKPVASDVQLTFEGKEYPVSLSSINFRVDLDGMVQEAFYVGKRSPGVLRIVRQLGGLGINKDIPVLATCSQTRLESVVTTIARSVDRSPSNASISVSTGSLKVVPSKLGVKIRIDDTVKAVEKALPTTKRKVAIVADMIQPQITDSDVSKVVWIRQKDFTLYLYDRENEVNSYKIAVGMPQYPTPNGRYHITYKEKNPTWLPTSEWAKDKQGIPQPPGPDNPLGGYWMDIGGGLGIHATPYPKTLGERASHGCIRMSEEGAADLFNQVKVGTPVLITD